MSKNAVLFLTTPNSVSRQKLSLKSFKQLEKIGCDIITLSTVDNLPDYIYEKSKLVISDYTNHICYKQDYYNYFSESNGFGYFFWENNDAHTARFFHDTHFPSVLRNTKTLIHIANSMGYEKYFFVEDDHFFHDDDLFILEDYFKKLDEYQIVVFKINNKNNNDFVYCSWFHFGKCKELSQLFKNVVYNRDSFIKNKEIYLHFYERLFKNIVDIFKDNNFKILEITDNITGIFKNSLLNQIYFFNSLESDIRCNFIIDLRNNTNVFYYKSDGIKDITNIKLYIDTNLVDEINLSPHCWFYKQFKDEDINKVYIIINNKIKKSFENLKINSIKYNGHVNFN